MPLHEMLIPSPGESIIEVEIGNWLKKSGDYVNVDDLLCEIETDKATMEFEAVDEGILAKIIVAEGTEGVLVNSPIAMMADEATENTVDVKPIEKNVQTDASSTRTELKSHETPLSGMEAEWGADIQTKTQTVREAIRDAMAEEMRKEYELIADHGVVLQLDCPDLAMERHVAYQDEPIEVFQELVSLHITAINQALRNIPRDQVRLHAGNH